MSAEETIKKAEFNPSVCTYWLLSGSVTLLLTIIGIPLLILWIPLGLLFTRRYLSRMECVLTTKALKVKKGILVRTEKTIPLEKITDMGMVQGPIMRSFSLHRLSVETAGQSGPGSLVSLTGIVDAPSFREAVLNQRDATSISSDEKEAGNEEKTVALLTEIRDSLSRIEAKMEESESG
ncbi:MAG: PH domain-containing protein [Verrucomicrobiota bacterium]